MLALHKAWSKPFSERCELDQLLTRLSPDLILTLSFNQTSSYVGSIAKKLNVPVVLWLQSNADLEPKLFQDIDYIDRYGVRHEHAMECVQVCRNIICQSDWQQTALASVREYFPKSQAPLSSEIRSTVIVNPVSTERFTPNDVPNQPNRTGVLWIGRADRFHKRPLLALDIARRCPSIPFTMVLNPGDSDVRKEIEDRMTPNVSLVDFVPLSEMPQRMQRSRIFLSTGSASYEGFPNVLLEAAASGTPIVSLEDFDGFLIKSEAGGSSEKDVKRAADRILRLNESQMEWEKVSQNCLAYVKQHHSMDAAIKSFRDFSKATVGR
jgi:glycosyltransferase involved in cell wall biosynthesis